MNLFTAILSLGGLLGGVLSLKFLVINHFRVNRSVGNLLYKKIIADSNFKFIAKEELVFDKKDPSILKGLFKLNSIFIFFDKGELLLQAGWTAKESIIDIYFFRWNTDKIKNLLKDISKSNSKVNIYAMSPWGNINIGSMECNNYSINVDKELYEDIEKDINRVLAKEIDKTSALLYGSPGNGKTRFIKYIAQKYELPIYTFYLHPDYSNLSIQEAFSTIPEKCIVLFEDFDNYFDDRKCIMPNDKINFTYDVLLNCLDGVYNDYKEVIFFMTVNDLDKVSTAMKNRPSRFKYVREFTNPTVELKTEILGNKLLAENIGDVSLDQVFKLKDYIETNGEVTIEMAKKIISNSELKQELSTWIKPYIGTGNLNQ